MVRGWDHCVKFHHPAYHEITFVVPSFRKPWQSVRNESPGAICGKEQEQEQESLNLLSSFLVLFKDYTHLYRLLQVSSDGYHILFKHPKLMITKS